MTRFSTLLLTVLSITHGPTAYADALKLKSAGFSVTTTVPGAHFNGDIKEMKGEVSLNKAGVPVALSITVLPDALSTGLPLRDRHLRKNVLSDADGKVHPVTFKSSKVSCKGSKCEATGALSMRGVSRTLKLPFTYQNREASGHFSLKLTDYGIEPPGTS